ncbi:MAG: hypothetical protein WBC51_04995 [Vicinamibacterales bacterium]
MRISPTHTVDHFLRLHRTLIIETREFRDLRHNDDLCPRFQLQLEAVLRAVGQFEPVVYDTQGLIDHGADIVVRIRHQERLDQEAPELLGFQIKSFEDFRRSDLFRALKAQRDDALRKIPYLAGYYIVLCTDEDRDKDAIRNIEAEFRGAERTIVIEPTYSLNFLRLPDRRIQGLVTRMMQSQDFVFREAVKTIELSTPTAGLLAVYLATLAAEGRHDISVYDLKHQGRLRDLYESALETRRNAAERYKEPAPTDETDRFLGREPTLYRPPTEQELKRMAEVFYDDFEDALAFDLEQLDMNLIDIAAVSGRITVRPEEMLALTALLTDAKVRYGLAGWELFSYGAEALGALDA